MTSTEIGRVRISRNHASLKIVALTVIKIFFCGYSATVNHASE